MSLKQFKVVTLCNLKYCPVFLKLEFSRETLATLSAHCEHYIGTQGGGMDQAIAFLATAG